MQYLTSSAIRAVDYNEAMLTLTVWFTESGGPYAYYNVPKSEYRGLLAANSSGAYFNSHIRAQYAA
ncbi:KTSC domain-containing protein [Sphingomonas paeninsulae]|jgi:hypothetical protein|uniref:KTSC domain-containing protein n=1 Tax=Sphingomonas paeninsulae TaxID=2319844 RepID=A0A494TLG8_SPHPE|nr:KTSC domain-containing protein [Sphingomonas paeninsulae]AYJ86676.1 KTSC domain-containing protein [Sphingomonas paeninsulae]